jgi:hypothetical protein
MGGVTMCAGAIMGIGVIMCAGAIMGLAGIIMRIWASASEHTAKRRPNRTAPATKYVNVVRMVCSPVSKRDWALDWRRDTFGPAIDTDLSGPPGHLRPLIINRTLLREAGASLNQNLLPPMLIDM